jgi:hypothetical protein
LVREFAFGACEDKTPIHQRPDQDRRDGSTAYRDYVTVITTSARRRAHPARGCEIVSQQQQEKQMTLPTNNDIASRELSIEELDAIAAAGLGSWLKGEVTSAWHGLERAGEAVAHFFAPDIKITFTYGGHQPGRTPLKVS